MSTALIGGVVLALLLGVALVFDLRYRRIPNWLIAVGLISGFACSLLPSDGLSAKGLGSVYGMSGSFFGMLTGFAIMLPFYLLRAMGAGDVKLVAVVGAFLGPPQTGGMVLLTFLAGGVFSLLAALLSRSLPGVMANLRLMGSVVLTGRMTGLSLRDVATTGRLPYALAIATGTGLQICLARFEVWPFS